MSNSKKKNQLDFLKILEIDIKMVIIETIARKNKIIATQIGRASCRERV